MLRILHLSDLHFGLLPKDRTSAHRFVDQHGNPNPETLSGILVEEVDQPPDVIVVSGDVGWSGASDDYTWAHSFLVQLRKRWSGVPLVIASGNHDVDRTKFGAERQGAFIDFLKKVQGSHFQEQHPLFMRSPGDRRMLVAFERVTKPDGDDVLIVAANSAAYLEEKGEPVGFAAEELRAIEEHVRSMALPESTLRLFVLHHALFPFAEPTWTNTIDTSALNEKPDMTIVANSATLQGWLAKHAFRVVLHGHKHAMHGRNDRLWRKDPRASGKIFVVGAGSTGVEQGHRAHNEPLSFNILDVTRLSRRRWWLDVSVREFLDPPEKPREAVTFGDEVGESIEGAPLVFHAEGMVDCHRAIRRACVSKKEGEDGEIFQNFISVVESPTFTIPPTARFHGKEVEQPQIDGTFQALHPEHSRTDEWKELDRIDSALREVSPRLQFQHGPRMFGRPNGMKQSPIEKALEQLQSSKDLGSDAYASLFRPDVDVPRSNDDLMPHLMGIQFIPEGDYLDIVVTFRKIELSYWWVANMYEVGKLLQWAARYKSGKKRRTARRITFVAALAQWKDKPEAAFVTKLDRMKLEELTALIAGVCREDTRQGELVELLNEKLEHTNERNLDAKGLDELRAVFLGLLASGPVRPPPKGFIEKIAEAAGHIHEAVALNEPAAKTEKARAALVEAIKLLGGSPVDT